MLKATNKKNEDNLNSLLYSRLAWLRGLVSAGRLMPSLQPIVRVIWSLRLKSQTDRRQISVGSRHVARTRWNSWLEARESYDCRTTIVRPSCDDRASILR